MGVLEESPRLRALTLMPALAVASTVALSSCADAGGDAKSKRGSSSSEAAATVKASDFDIKAMAELLKEGEVGSGEGLERAINAEETRINNVDVDGDGEVDTITLDESREQKGTIVFELRAIPSSTGARDEAVAIAKLGFTIEGEKAVGEVIFTDEVDHGGEHATFEFTVKFKGGSLYSTDMFVAWVLAPNRPLYHGGLDGDVRVDVRRMRTRKPKKHKKSKKPKKGR